MSTRQSVLLPLRGRFKEIYRELDRRNMLEHTPIIFCEGDSWFSTPLTMNLLDWLVFPSPEEEAQGVPLFGRGGLFFRDESSGALATEMFTAEKVAKLKKWYKGFKFDLVLISAGGNDFVDDFLAELFEGQSALSVDEAVALVVNSGRYEEILAAYRVFINGFLEANPESIFIGHTYDYPLKLGQPGELTVGNLGLAALLKRSVGDWIGTHIRGSLEHINEQRQFAKRLVDEFKSRVLDELKAEFTDQFFFVDFRGSLTDENLWFDEMHPTGEGFFNLAQQYRAMIKARLPLEKLV